MGDDLNSKIEGGPGKLSGKSHIFSLVLFSDNVTDTAEEQMLYEIMKFLKTTNSNKVQSSTRVVSPCSQDVSIAARIHIIPSKTYEPFSHTEAEVSASKPHFRLLESSCDAVLLGYLKHSSVEYRRDALPKNSFISFSKIHPEDNKAEKHHYFKVKHMCIIQTLTIYGAAGTILLQSIHYNSYG